MVLLMFVCTFPDMKIFSTKCSQTFEEFSGIFKRKTVLDCTSFNIISRPHNDHFTNLCEKHSVLILADEILRRLWPLTNEYNFLPALLSPFFCIMF